MQVRPLLLALLLLAAALAGCSQSPSPPADGGEGDGEPVDGDGRTARPGRGGSVDAENVTLREVEILREPLQLVGQGPVSFDVVVPPAVEGVVFQFTDGATYQGLDVYVDLSGCGYYGGGTGSFAGSFGGYFQGDLCGKAEAGPQTATVSGKLVVFEGSFVLVAYVPDNRTAPVQS